MMLQNPAMKLGNETLFNEKLNKLMDRTEYIGEMGHNLLRGGPK
jgi:hypothetical protein